MATEQSSCRKDSSLVSAPASIRAIERQTHKYGGQIVYIVQYQFYEDELSDGRDRVVATKKCGFWSLLS